MAEHDTSRPAVIVVGAGAAGMVAAIFAARAGANVTLLEGGARAGSKVRLSGGGRCNLLPSRVSLEDYRTGGSHKAVRNVLLSWPLAEVRGFFEDELGVGLEVEPGGKIFPRSQRSQDVIDALLAECGRLDVAVVYEARIEAIRPCADPARIAFEIETHRAESYVCDRLILATGGRSLPKTGSDGRGLELAKSLGHAIEPTYPVLVPLTTSQARWRELPGVSLRARLRAVRGGRVIEEREGDFLFTHRGFSGPVVLDLSHHQTAPGGEDVEIVASWGGDAAPDWKALLGRGGKQGVHARIKEHLPRRLVDLLVELSKLKRDIRLCDLTKANREALIGNLDDCGLPIDGSEGYRTAEVTAGGVPLSDLKLKTLESRIVPGLHFAGEMLDVHGRIGGYNFLWAWVTGRRAGEGA